MESSYVIRKERCPECAKLGKDRSEDNLAIYSDGHRFCFSCGFHASGTRISRLTIPDTVPQSLTQTVTLPHDSSYDYPKVALDWIEQYEISRNDLLAHRVVYSDYYHRLIFPVYSGEGILAYQGRYFGNEDKPKWWGEGNLKDTLHILKGKDDSCIILVEDIISAIKLQKVGHTAMPLFGSHVDLSRLKRISKFYRDVLLWLDPNKRKESIKFMGLGKSLGLNMRVIFSYLDPKQHSILEIEEYLK